MLGQLYLHKEDYKMARELLEVVAKSSVEEEIRGHAEQLLKQLSTFEEAKAQVEEARRNRPKVIESEPVVTSGPRTTKPEDAPTDPSSYLREVLRTPGAGETQLQAKLVKIECEPKNVVFVVQTASGLLRLHTKTFDDIEITTYDPKVAGEISCGARKPENTVVVCYLSNGVLKSIEFVPADFKLK